ncbi:MAG: hypothetical protein AVDCRST_MAG91-1777 [uncultured Sphingomonadaceae bacterium]|uniref:Uncharacterized protein n=1 Tax=uncultured Sphingomonadaceae bacterium TaxID=169976 RepID=A0A6J4T446_9SPHN|nr:MAG: hypothetical protein AVDCRST_MAG91-1777 [uncultured Sphingomonadaceae bacterium]
MQRLGWLGGGGAVLLLVGIACLTVGILDLPPEVPGFFRNASPEDPAATGIVTETPVDGRRWLIFGTGVVTIGGALAVVAAMSKRSSAPRSPDG